MWLIKVLSVAAILMAVSAHSVDRQSSRSEIKGQSPHFISSLLQKIVEANKESKKDNLVVSPSGLINSLLPVIDLNGKYRDRFEFLHSLTTANISDPQVVSYITDSDIHHTDLWFYDEKIESKVMKHFDRIDLQPSVMEKHPLNSSDALFNYVKDGGVTIVGNSAFKLKWQYSFEKQLKNSRNSMSGTFNIFKGVLNDENGKPAEWIELPFKDGSTSMYVFTSKGSFEKLKMTVAKINFNNLTGKKEIVDVMLPKFKITSGADMQPILEEMGLGKMFQHSATPNLYVRRFGQSTTLSISELGAEAEYPRKSGKINSLSKESNAKPTTTVLQSRNNSFHVTGPFVYVIVDKSTGLPLLFGYSKNLV